MTTEFDPLRAARDELAAVADVISVCRRREHAAEAAISAAENELNAVRKVRGYAEIERDRIRRKMAEIEDMIKGET